MTTPPQKRWDSAPVLQTVDDYDGEPAVLVAATQSDLPRRQAASVVDAWCTFFSASPSPIEHLRFISRTPARLFASLAGQTQLKSLELKWGDYADLSALNEMSKLESLTLGGAASVTTIEPLAQLVGLRELELEGTRRVRDYSPIGRLRALRSLTVIDGINGPRVHADSIAFLRDLTSLEYLCWMPIVDDGDYSPALALTHVPMVYIASARNMVPSHADLEWALPGMQAWARDRAFAVVPVTIDGESAGTYETDVDGKMRFHPKAD